MDSSMQNIFVEDVSITSTDEYLVGTDRSDE